MLILWKRFPRCAIEHPRPRCKGCCHSHSAECIRYYPVCSDLRETPGQVWDPGTVRVLRPGSGTEVSRLLSGECGVPGGESGWWRMTEAGREGGRKVLEDRWRSWHWLLHCCCCCCGCWSCWSSPCCCWPCSGPARRSRTASVSAPAPCWSGPAPSLSGGEQWWWEWGPRGADWCWSLHRSLTRWTASVHYSPEPRLLRPAVTRDNSAVPGLAGPASWTCWILEAGAGSCSVPENLQSITG